jgi:hypothetical protein
MKKLVGPRFFEDVKSTKRLMHAADGSELATESSNALARALQPSPVLPR